MFWTVKEYSCLAGLFAFKAPTKLECKMNPKEMST